jgi:hypothetical protein
MMHFQRSSQSLVPQTLAVALACVATTLMVWMFAAASAFPVAAG